MGYSWDLVGRYSTSLSLVYHDSLFSFNHGQSCSAGSRIFVQSSIYNEFLERFTTRAKGIKLGDPFTPGTHQGPQISQVQYDRIMSYVRSGKEEGATCHLGGDRFGTEGFYIYPTIFTDVKPNMRIMKEEIFGPIAVVVKFETEEGEIQFVLSFRKTDKSLGCSEVIKEANESPYGLAAGVFTSNIRRAISATRMLQAGTVWVIFLISSFETRIHLFLQVNCANILQIQVPFGGYKQSGFGRECGAYALNK